MVSFFLFGFWWPYWRVADMDLWMVYGAFLANDRLPQEYFDHPGYLSFLLLSHWFRFLHDLGILGVDRLSALPAPADAGEAWTAAVRAGRVLSLALGIGLVVSAAPLLRRLTRDWRIAALATFFLAFSGGLEIRILRTEIISAGLTLIALLVLLIAARSPALCTRPLLVGAAALLCALAMLNKVQALFLICALPPIVLTFGTVPAPEDDNFWRRSRAAKLMAFGSLVAAALLAAAAWPLVQFGILRAAQSGFTWRPLAFGIYGTYQPLIALWLLGGMLLFARLYRVCALETIVAIASAVAGAALGLLALYIAYAPGNVFVVMNPLEAMAHMTIYEPLAGSGNLLSGKFFADLVEAAGLVFARHTFVLSSSPRPTLFLEWVVIAATVFAWRTGRWRLALQASCLLATVWGIDLFSALRGLKQEYFLYSDPLVIIAAVILFDNLPELRSHRLAFPLGVALIVAHIAVGQAEPVKHTFKRDVPTIFCAPHGYYTQRIECFSFCPGAAK